LVSALVGPGAELAGVILQALRHAASAWLDRRTVRLDFNAAFAGDLRVDFFLPSAKSDLTTRRLIRCGCGMCHKG
jgi:hypothetical protein